MNGVLSGTGAESSSARGASIVSDRYIRVEIKDRDGILKGELLIPNDKTYEGKGKKIRVSTLLSLLFSQGYKNMFIYLVHCRSIKDTPDTQGSSLMPEGRYPLVHLTPYNENTVYLVAQAHGETMKNDHLVPSDTISQADIDRVLYRANLGSKCRQHGVQAGEYQVYDEAMGLFASGADIKIDKTDDLLLIKGMTLVLSNYSLRGDARFARGASFSGVNVTTVITGREFKRTKRVGPGPDTSIIYSGPHLGGSIRKTVKRRKRKTKSRNRRR